MKKPLMIVRDAEVWAIDTREAQSSV